MDDRGGDTSQEMQQLRWQVGELVSAVRALSRECADTAETSRQTLLQLQSEMTKREEAHSEELRQQREEIYAAWRLDREDRIRERERLTEELSTVRGEILSKIDKVLNINVSNVVESLPSEEVKARQAIENEEASENPTSSILKLRSLFPLNELSNSTTSASIGSQLHSVWKYLASLEKPLPEPTRMILLSSQRHVQKLYLSVSPKKSMYADYYAVTLSDLDSFMLEVVCCLPSLQFLAIDNLPSLDMCKDHWLLRLPRSIKTLEFPAAAFSASTVRQLCASRKLTRIYLTASSCTNWGEDLERFNNKKHKLNVACSNVISWW